MKKRYLLTLFAVVLVALISVTPVSAYYSRIYGDLKDMKTLSGWQYGAEVTLYDIDGNVLTTNTVPLGQSYFDFAYDFSSAPSLIIVEVDFTCNPTDGCDGGDDPADATYFGIHNSDDSDTWDTGTYLANTGPTAVNITGLSGTSGMVLMGVLPMAAVAGLGAVKFNRKKRQ
jgi:hypothetical protein